MNVQKISPQEAQRMKESGQSVRIIDVRTPAEYAHVHAQGADLIPLDQLDPQAASMNGERLLLICQSGARATKGCEKLLSAGCREVYCIEGGTAAWQQAGLPVVRGQSKVISLERQVRIGAGLLVLIGLGLAWLIHPAFAGLSAFVGAGLIFAGLTDWCGMGMILAKMPWNRGGACGSCCGSQSS
ncbi:MAG: rhodanese-like domain-containing protein [Phycisphaerales bacterium]|nr:rhodanese-like domain-containing protein [Phycisphaerales bacterium]